MDTWPSRIQTVTLCAHSHLIYTRSHKYFLFSHRILLFNSKLGTHSSRRDTGRFSLARAHAMVKGMSFSLGPATTTPLACQFSQNLLCQSFLTLNARWNYVRSSEKYWCLGTTPRDYDVICLGADRTWWLLKASNRILKCSQGRDSVLWVKWEGCRCNQDMTCQILSAYGQCLEFVLQS